MRRNAVSENVRRYRTIASLYRQTAAFRPDQKWSLLAQAFEHESVSRGRSSRDTLLATTRRDRRWQQPRKVVKGSVTRCLANGRMVERASVWWFHSYSPPLNDATRRRKLAAHFVIVCALFTALLMAL
jgi:hypothetical protein